MTREYPETRRCAVTDDGKWCAIGSLAVIGVVLVSLFLAFRRLHLADKGRPCPTGAAGLVVERVNGEAAVRFCNRVADAVFGVK